MQASRTNNFTGNAEELSPHFDNSIDCTDPNSVMDIENCRPNSVGGRFQEINFLLTLSTRFTIKRTEMLQININHYGVRF